MTVTYAPPGTSTGVRQQTRPPLQAYTPKPVPTLGGGPQIAPNQGGGIVGNMVQNVQNAPPRQTMEQFWGSQPGAIQNPTNDPGVNKYNGTQYIFQNAPHLGTIAGGMPNPAQNYNNIGGAQGAIGGGFNSAYQGPQGNPFMPPFGGGGGGPQVPNIQGAPTQYNYQGQQAPMFQGPQFDQMRTHQFNPNSVQGPNWMPQQGFDPNSVGGPNMPQIRQPNAQFGGPQLNAPTNGPSPNVPGFRDIVDMSRQLGGGGNVPREQLQGSGFEQNQNFGQFNSLAGQGLQSGLANAQSLAQGGGFGVDSAALDAAAKRQYELAAQAGADKAIGRGFSPSGGTIGGREIGRAVADEAGRQAAQRQQLILQAEQAKQQGRIAGVNALQGIGGTSGGLAGDQAGRLMNENQFLGGSGIQQRGQDIDLARLGQSGQQGSLSALGNLAGTLGGLNINSFEAGTGRAGTLGNLGLGAFNAGTNRGQAMGDMDLRAQQLAQQGALGGYEAQTGRAGTFGNLYNQNQQMNQQGLMDAYRAQTDRMGTQGDIYNRGVSNQNDAYGNATQRGLGVGGLQQDANQLGFNYANMNNQANQFYDQLGAQNQNQYNQNLIDLFGIQGNQYNQNQQNQQGWANMYQQGQIEAGRQGLGQGQFGLDYLNSAGNAQNQWNNQQIGANQFDLGQFWDQYSQNMAAARQAQQARMDNRFNFGRDVRGGTIGAVGQIAGGFLGGGGNPQMPQLYQGQIGPTTPYSPWGP